MTLEETLRRIVPADRSIEEEAWRRWDSIAKPLRGLGLLEEAVARIAGMTRTVEVDLSRRAVAVFCADNGVVEEGVTQTGQEVTAVVTENLSKGDTSVCKMARVAHADVFPVDIGVKCAVTGENILPRKVAHGTRNMTKGPAMTREETVKALEVGIELMQDLKQQGYRIVATGEMGIGNTTTSSAVASVLLQKDPELVTGAGAGLDSAGLKRKTEAIRRGIGLHHPDPMDGMEVLQKVGGFDLAAMAGAFLGGAIYHVPVVIDGVIAAAAAAAAGRIAPAATDYMLAAHVSAEPASIWLLDLIGVTPAIQAGLRLGEGTGALALFPLLDMALSIYRDMDTFAEMEIEEYKPLV